MPDTCVYVLDPGCRYGDTPEPPEFCDADAVPGTEFCTRHQEED